MKKEPEKPVKVEKEAKRGRWEEDSDSEEEKKRKVIMRRHERDEFILHQVEKVPFFINANHFRLVCRDLLIKTSYIHQQGIQFR